MRDQYVGDVSDLLKYALLRTLAATDRRLGVAWYYNPDCDGRNDGRHTEYLREDKWLALDGCVLNALRSLPERSVAAVERLPIWPAEVRFYREPVPASTSRAGWVASMAQQLEKCNLVFIDPDNGVGRLGRRHASFEEIRRLRRPGNRALVLIKFPARIRFDEQEDAYHEALRANTGADEILTLRTSVTVVARSGRPVPTFRWFTMLDLDDCLVSRFVDFARKLDSIPGATAMVRTTCPRAQPRERGISLQIVTKPGLN
jgi:hypothetical protein